MYIFAFDKSKEFNDYITSFGAPYTYCVNNSMMCIDPEGRYTKVIQKDIIREL